MESPKLFGYPRPFHVTHVTGALGPFHGKGTWIFRVFEIVSDRASHWGGFFSTGAWVAVLLGTKTVLLLSKKFEHDWSTVMGMVRRKKS